ncbi:DUF1800 domain-containing protein [Novosphingobium sp.]|jgi:uncharacterized protein (DUF1800 family)|uniref:DUF1800 domain-containing protein n=1 Tax=Novosphingobium sp. TaxID=1874826 RepID=UPI0022BCF309|nr:DUF1800 domain-containing protein [Novosphingobium sp.]MCZ8017521.1 DUF1800 domain-containing protein [Novosphingobium sp.]MCZ8033955.1 DUF1800 domain-containing protein [Novosphingobium sp.]MCZ8051311.1 DUF1800 domain-containing protein [Novosphingobium sp.]MCZ8059657.1 DUF1800 domain-containing protein [Novosphingobium sp.]MCZ8231495.1 DUF1800 domain-containing protein [Novosphingobium sp.]
MRESSVALNRFGLGGRKGEAVPQEPRRWLLDQFGKFDPRPAAITSLPASPALIVQFREARAAQREMRDENPAADAAKPGTEARPDIAPELRPYRGLRDVYAQAAAARTNLALTTPTPFVERLVHFWANHFAVSIDKIVTLGIAGAFEFEAIRPNVLGKFTDLLLAVERHPAMLLYLDQAQSVGPDSVLGKIAARRGNQRGLNENLAREILELHTLGVRSGYDQGDVTELARALTGWTVGGLADQPMLRGPGPGYWFAGIIHQPGDRKVLGKRYDQDGERQGEAILRDLAVHPATARHIATKLARHFAADDPPPSLVARLEAAFLKSGGDLPTVYRALIEAPEPWAASPAKFRTPWDWTLASLRAVGTQTLPVLANANTFNQLGQPIWRPGSPAGWDDMAPSWAGPDALYRRVEVAERIASRTAAIDARKLAEDLFPGALSEPTRKALAGAESPTQALALLLASPEMMRR